MSISRADASAIINQLSLADRTVGYAHDTLTGRDTHPLYDESGSVDPQRFWIAVELQRIADQIHTLKMHIGNLKDFNES